MLRPHSILLNAEALSALARGDKRMHGWAEVARRTDSVLYASTVTLAEVADGSTRDVGLRRTAKAVRFVEVSNAIGYRGGALRAEAARRRRKARDLTIDALVAATAGELAPPVVVLTSDVEDLALLLTATDVQVERV